jgi:hypothetical protein
MHSSSWHSISWFGSYVGHPSCQYGGPSSHSQDVPPFVFPRDSAPIASGFVLHATASVVSSLGGTVALLSSLFHADVSFFFGFRLDDVFHSGSGIQGPLWSGA